MLLTIIDTKQNNKLSNYTSQNLHLYSVSSLIWDRNVSSSCHYWVLSWARL